MLGLFGTRADALVDLVFALVVATPVVMLWSLRFVRRRNYAAHRRVQTILLVVMILGVLAFELDIRLSGGSGSLVAASPYAHTPGFRWLAIAHIAGAVATYLLWTATVWVSRRRHGTRLPGSFSATHRLLGWTTIAGAVYTAVTATAMYTLGFIA